MAPEGFTHCGCEPSLHPGGTVLRPASLTSRVPSGPRVSLRGWLSPEATTWKAGGPGSELAVVAAALEALWMPLADAIGAGSVALRVATKTMARATFRWERRWSEGREENTLTSDLVASVAVSCVPLSITRAKRCEVGLAAVTSPNY
jgi:hypothetical protein